MLTVLDRGPEAQQGGAESVAGEVAMGGRFVLVEHGHGIMDDRVTMFLRERGVEPMVIRPFAGEALGKVDGSVMGSVVFGGPFSVFEEDRHPFLNDENRWIEQCLIRDVPLLGICQGAQSIAHVLGAWVGPLESDAHEFGYYEVTPTDAGRTLIPRPMHLVQAHFHGFDLPEGAALLATGEVCPHQAFSYGSALAFQFHAEVTPAQFRRMQDADWAPYGKPGVQDRAEQDRLMAAHDARQHDWFIGVLERHFDEALAA
ncbi:MAG: glutamine amidotransferase [Paracoccaceae bacterium]